MTNADFAAVRAALSAVLVPPAKTPLRHVIEAWWHPVDAPPNDEEQAGAAAMADQMLDDLAILARLADGSTLTQSLLGDRLWSLLEDPFTVFYDVSPRHLRAAGFIALACRGSVHPDRVDTYSLTPAGYNALRVLRLWNQRR